jgi:hypothetical protein
LGWGFCRGHQVGLGPAASEAEEPCRIVRHDLLQFGVVRDVAIEQFHQLGVVGLLLHRNRVTQTVDGNKGIHMLLAKDLL